LRVGQRKIFLCDGDLSPRQIKSQSAYQWLRKTERQRGRILRIQSRELTVAGLPNRGEINVIVTAELWRQAFQPARVGEVRSLDRAARAAKKTHGRCQNSFEVALRAQARIVSATHGQQVSF